MPKEAALLLPLTEDIRYCKLAEKFMVTRNVQKKEIGFCTFTLPLPLLAKHILIIMRTLNWLSTFLALEEGEEARTTQGMNEFNLC